MIVREFVLLSMPSSVPICEIWGKPASIAALEEGMNTPWFAWSCVCATGGIVGGGCICAADIIIVGGTGKPPSSVAIGDGGHPCIVPGGHIDWLGDGPRGCGVAQGMVIQTPGLVRNLRNYSPLAYICEGN